MTVFHERGQSGVCKINFVTSKQKLISAEGKRPRFGGRTRLPTEKHGLNRNSRKISVANFTTYITSSFLTYNFVIISPDGDRMTQA